MRDKISNWLPWKPKYLTGQTEAFYRQEGVMMRCRITIILREDQEALAMAYTRCPPTELPESYRARNKTVPVSQASAALKPAGWFLGIWMPPHWVVQITTVAAIDGWSANVG